LKKVDNKIYELTVLNNVDSIKIKAKLEDSKAKVAGDGEKKLEIGLNTFPITVTSESGVANEYKINVTRKDSYYLEDVNAIMNDQAIDNIEIKLDVDADITKETLDKVKESKKVVKFSYYNEDKKMLYNWSIDGKLLQNTETFNTKVEFNLENIEEISKISNYAQGLCLNFKHSGNLPNGTKIKVYVGDDYQNDSLVNVYYYNKEANKLELIVKDINVVEGYIEFDIEHCSDYFVTKSVIQQESNISNNIETNKNIFAVIALVELVLIMIIVIMDYLGVNPISKRKN